jgi:hypothetical protein
MDNVVLAEILKAHEDRTARLHAMVLDARDAILTAIKSQDDPPVWMREAFDKLHAVHHGMGGDPFQMHMRAAVEVACERLREAIADFMVEHVAIPGKSSYGLADEILAAAFAPSERRQVTEADDDETYEIGKRDGYSEAVQEIDRLTGGDGEYRYCTNRDPDRHTPDPATMIRRIVDRFAAALEPVAVEAEPVAWQWRALEEGRPMEEWSDMGIGDRPGWEALAARNPAKYSIEKRALYATPLAVDQAMREATIAGWNACRKSIYAVCEDVSDEADRIRIKGPVGTHSEEQHAKGYHAGMHRAAKSIARGFNSMEAEDDDYLAAAIRRLAEGGDRD